MMKKIFLIKLLAISLLSGCSTINFEKEKDTSTPVDTKVTYEQWHHNVAFSLFEISAPVDLSKECADKTWSSVKTELSFINGLASTIVFGPIWYPKTVEVSCQ